MAGERKDMQGASPSGSGHPCYAPSPQAVSASGGSPSREPRFWLELREPHRLPERKGPWPARDAKKILREFMRARPSAYITTVTMDEEGTPHFEDGAAWLALLDGRSASVSRTHSRTTHEAHAGLRPARGGETRRAETGTGSVHEHPVAEGQAPDPTPTLKREGQP